MSSLIAIGFIIKYGWLLLLIPVIAGLIAQ